MKYAFRALVYIYHGKTSTKVEIRELRFLVLVRPGGVMVNTLAHNTEDRWHSARELCSNQSQVAV